jgi:hypothetical protein
MVAPSRNSRSSEAVTIMHHDRRPLNGAQPVSLPLRATFIGSDRCDAEGFSAVGYTPFCDLCRQLLDAGFASSQRLHVYRGDTFCFAHSIGEGARLTVCDDDDGSPIFIAVTRKPIKGRPEG